jgi:Tfp pilus assembly protein PilO
MALINKENYNRYSRYWQNLKQFYQKPVAYVSTALILTLFAIVFFALFAIRPTLTTVAGLVKKIEDQQKVEQKLAQKTAALATVQSEYLFARDKLGFLDTAIPVGHQLPRLLKEVEYMAASHNLQLSNIRMENFTLAQPVGKQTDEEIKEIAFSVTTTAPYLTLKTFLNDLVNLDRVLKVDAFSLAESKTQSQPGVTMTVFLRAFYLPESKGE